MVQFGSSDCSMSLGLTGQRSHPDVVKAERKTATYQNDSTVAGDHAATLLQQQGSYGRSVARVAATATRCFRPTFRATGYGQVIG